jgi:hypothetical protein
MQNLIRNNITLNTITEYLEKNKSETKEKIISAIYDYLTMFDDEFIEKFQITEDRINDKKIELIALESGFEVGDYNGIKYIKNNRIMYTFIILNNELVIGNMLEVCYDYIKSL